LPTGPSASSSNGSAATLLALIEAFPTGAPDIDGELALVFAKGRLFEGALDESAAYIAAARRLGDAVPAERRWRFDLQLLEAELALARRRGNVGTAVEAMRAMEELLAAQPLGELALSNDLRAAALMDLGIAELWSSRLADARRHLQQGLELAQRIGRPYLQIGCLAHLAMAAPLAGLRASVAWSSQSRRSRSPATTGGRRIP
jgi:LuxR family maltose regulon positive regulatory protein